LAKNASRPTNYYCYLAALCPALRFDFESRDVTRLLSFVDVAFIELGRPQSHWDAMDGPTPM